MSEWRTATLEEGLEQLLDYRGKSPPKSVVGIPVISAKVVKGGRITRPIEQTIEPSFYPVWMTRGLPKVTDVVMTTEGPMGEVAQLDDETVKFALGQRVVCLRGKQGVLDNSFLKFLLMSPLQQDILSSYGTGTTVEGISQKSLRRVPISLPPYGEQVRIGSLLSTLDDKIELDRRMNETLEAMARAVFKDWFVNFGPTRAKMEGQQYYLAPEIWSLFPDRLDDEEKPNGWRVSQLGCVCQLNPTERLTAGVVAPYLEMSALPTEGSNHDAPVPRPFSSGTKFRDGDTLLARITPCLENGKATYVRGLGDDVVGWGSTEFIVIRPRPPLPPGFGYLVARDEAFRDHAIRSMTGTSGRQRAQTDQLAKYPVIMPSEEIANAFGKITSDWFDMIAVNASQSQTLASLRDLLLPKLMSGEIRVKEAQKVVAELV